MKRLQVIAILSACSYLLFKAVSAHSHVEIHFDSLEWEAIQQKLEEAQKELEVFQTLYPDDGSEEYKELEDRVKSGDAKLGLMSIDTTSSLV